jgi:signal transduction histidine kinase
MTKNSTDQKLKTVEQQLAIEKEASDFLIQQANERIVVLNPDFTISAANEPYIKAVGKTQDQVVGAHCYQVTHGLKAPCSSSQPGFGCPLVETLRTGESAHVIHEHPTPEDQPIYCDMVTYPVKDQAGDIVRVIEIWRDITEALSSKWEQRVKELTADFKKLIQEDRMISLGKLVASSVHEINNPIQGLLTFSHLMLQTLEEGDPSSEDLEDFKKHLSLMSSELERCGNIISGLLSFSRQSEMEYADNDLNDILNQVVQLTRHKVELCGIHLILELYSNPLMINGDVNQLQQCFLNLIFNAIEGMPEGGQLSIISEFEKDKRHARVEIRDTGCGIQEQYLEHIFDPFFSTKEEGEGIGMGLSIVHGIVKNHGGNIHVASQEGKGSSFVLSFPIS